MGGCKKFLSPSSKKLINLAWACTPVAAGHTCLDVTGIKKDEESTFKKYIAALRDSQLKPPAVIGWNKTDVLNVHEEGTQIILFRSQIQASASSSARDSKH